MTHFEQIAAYYYPAAKRPGATAWVRIEELANGQRVCLYEGAVGGKREARAVAVQFNATPWNF